MRRICDGARELLRCTTGRVGTTLASGRVRSGAVRDRVLRRNRAAGQCCSAALDSAAQRSAAQMLCSASSAVSGIVGTIHARVTYSVTL